MMKKLAALVALVAFCAPLAAYADIPTVSTPFSVTTATTTPWLALSGQSVCTVTYTSVGGGSTATVQGASDAVPTPVTVTGIGASGVITNPSVNTATGGSVAPQALTQIRLSFSAVTSGTIAGTLTCSPATSSTVSTTPSGTQNVAVTNPGSSPVPVVAATTLPVSLATLPPIAFATTQPVAIASPLGQSANAASIPTVANPLVATATASFTASGGANNVTIPLGGQYAECDTYGSSVGSPVGTVTFTTSHDAVPTYFSTASSTLVSSSPAIAVSAASWPFQYSTPVYGASNFQALVTAYVSGTLTLTVTCSSVPIVLPTALGQLSTAQTTSNLVPVTLAVQHYVNSGGTTTRPVVGQNVASGGQFMAGYENSGGQTALVPAIACDKNAVVAISTATTTSIVAVSTTTAVYVCAYHLYVVSGTLPSFVIEGGTGAACVTTQAPLTGTFGGIAGAIGESFQAGSGTGAILRTAASSALCIVTGGTTPNIQGWISYAQF